MLMFTVRLAILCVALWGSMVDFGGKTQPAPEIYGDFWLNSQPLLLTALRGNVILIDFWDYSVVHSVRTIPSVVQWDSLYREKGLVCIGIHSPQFQFGQNFENVERAVRTLGIEYPVVMDNHQLLWGRFHNRYLPTKYLIDKDGYIRHAFIGGGDSAAVERAIQILLREAGCYESFPLPVERERDIEIQETAIQRTTPDMIAGYIQGALGNTEGYAPESTLDYNDPGYYIEGKFYLQGRWRSGRTSFQLLRDRNTTGRIIVPYSGMEVHIVIEPPAGTTAIARIFQDSHPLQGQDFVPGSTSVDNGTIVLHAANPGVYCLVRNREFGSHMLSLDIETDGFTFHALSFVSGFVQEVIHRN